MAQPLIQPKDVQPTTRRIAHLWDRRMEILRREGTLPRDFLENDPFYVDMNPEAKKHVTLIWISDLIAKTQMVLPGWRKEVYEPVTPEVAEEFGIRPRVKTTTPDGVPKAGFDMVLHWAPKAATDQIMAHFREQANIDHMMARTKQKLAEEGLHAPDELIGDFKQVESYEGLVEESGRSRQEVGDTTFGQPPKQ